jgi:signal transduction histidine kinase
MINSKGLDAAIKEISNPKGSFVWKDSYVFLMNLDGKMLAHPFQPELTQQDHVLLMTDPTDKALFVHFVNLARNVGHGWVENPVRTRLPRSCPIFTGFRNRNFS